MVAHLRLVLRVVAITLLVSALITGIGKIFSPAVKVVVPIISSVANTTPSVEPSRIVVSLDEPEDIGPTVSNPTPDPALSVEASPLLRSVSYTLWDDLYKHVHRVDQISQQIHHLAHYSYVQSEDDECLNEISKRMSVLEKERVELIRRLRIEVADFDGYYDLVLGNTIVPAWVNSTLNSAGLEKAMWVRRGSPGRLDTTDFSRPEFQAELISHILYIPEN